MSIADKLTLLINTKQDIKSAISEKGVEVTGGMTTYADAIRRIETGGGGDSFYVPVGLKFAYKYPPKSDTYNIPKFTLPKLILADGYTDGTYMFDGNESLTSLNGIYSSNSSLIDCRYMFNNCISLESILHLDSSNVTDMSYMFYNCKNLTTIPQMITSSVTNMSHMFRECSSLATIPQLDTSKVTTMWDMFWGCSSLTTVPQLDTSSVTDMGGMFLECSSLTTIPQLDTSNARGMNSMFDGCTSLTNVPLLDLSNVTSTSGMFDGCTSLTTIPQLDTSNVIHMTGMFWKCSKLKSLPLLDTSRLEYQSHHLFDEPSESNLDPYPELTDLGGFKNLKYDLNALNGMPNLTVQSLMNVINNLYDYKANGSTITRDFTIGNYNLRKLTAEQKAVATNKGWILK